MIASFKDKETEKVFKREHSRRIPQVIQKAAHRKLVMLHAAAYLEDLNSPPGNRLESLRGDRKGQHSIRINDRYRICFVWVEGKAHEVEIVDYHKG
ncbi:MAG: type II toxin-antitoxin system RelE/ParE family toxin [Deltaproteobacteria bacterium]|nr:type II toxin-antitoxin system RelE/ParE family toxin [Deltaproteobacteria bacterium]